MKSSVRFLIIVCAIAAALFALDRAFGFTMEHLTRKASGGDTANFLYINTALDDSIIVMGSSRANHHYHTPLLADSLLRMPAYNAGSDGNGILMANMMLNNILAHGHKPKVILYDFFPKFDLFENNDHIKPMARMRPYIDIPGMDAIVDDIDPSENIKNLSQTYRYNSAFLQIISDYLRPQQKVAAGYKPLYGEIESEFTRPDRIADASAEDSLKVKYLRKLTDECRREGIRLVFIVSPYYFPGLDFHTARLREIAGADAEILDFSSDTAFALHKELFQDPSHLNDKGAAKFTRMLADTLTLSSAPASVRAPAK